VEPEALSPGKLSIHMGGDEIMQIHIKVQNYLKKRFGPETSLIGVKRLGEGIHGVAYLLKFRSSGKEHRLIMKTLFPSGFGHDHFSDRAQVLILANATYNEMQRHIKAVDVVGEAVDRFISLRDADEFYLIMEEAQGESYFRDLDGILERGKLTDLDLERAGRLAHYIAEIHATKYHGKDAGTIYRRRIRDLVGHGECIMGIIDTYDQPEYVNDQELVEYTLKCVHWWGKIRDRGERLCRVHGDYHPGNIWFHGDDFTLLDRSRGSWGEPADDVSCLGINYIYYAIKDRGTFEGPFAELFRCFLRSYLQETNDDVFFEVTQPFFAFRVLVLANPAFYPDDTAATKRKLLDFGHSVLKTEKFEVEKIPGYLNRK
jgi:hypothetical protein